MIVGAILTICAFIVSQHAKKNTIEAFLHRFDIAFDPIDVLSDLYSLKISTISDPAK